MIYLHQNPDVPDDDQFGDLFQGQNQELKEIQNQSLHFQQVMLAVQVNHLYLELHSQIELVQRLPVYSLQKLSPQKEGLRILMEQTLAGAWVD